MNAALAFLKASALYVVELVSQMLIIVENAVSLGKTGMAVREFLTSELRGQIITFTKEVTTCISNRA